MGIIRVAKVKNYSVISNTLLTDKQLSWGARGLAAYMLSKPDGWHFRTAHLIGESKDCGRDKLRNYLKELEDLRYLSRKTIRKIDGTFDYELVLSEEPATVSPAPDFPAPAKAAPIVNTDSVNTDLSKYRDQSRSRERKFNTCKIPELMGLTPEREAAMRAVGCTNPKEVFDRFYAYYANRPHYRVKDWDAELIIWTKSSPKQHKAAGGAAPPPYYNPETFLKEQE